MSLRPEPPAPNTLGDRIRHYRLRQRQIHTGTPWAQEDLAVAISSDKSHVNRIERGHAVPTRRTLERICEALALSWPERVQIFSLAGYMIDLPRPTQDEVDRLKRHVAPLLSSSSYPVCLMDRHYRIWDLNELHAECWLGFPDRASAIQHIGGLRTIDKLLDPRISEWWQAVIVDFDAYARRALMRFARTSGLYGYDSELEATVKRLNADSRYGPLWAEVTSSHSDDSVATPFLDHQLVHVNHPEFGPYKIWIWHSSLTADERFFLSHHVPADGESQALFEHLTVRRSPRRPQATPAQRAI